MSSVYPVPSTRASGLLASTRLLTQMQSDYLDLLRLQSQVSTGRRITLPSEDAPAAQRAIILQRLLEQKTQTRTNLETTNSYTSASDAAIGSVSSLLINAKATALGAATNLVSDSDRSAAAADIDSAIRQLTQLANQKFRDRYLFGGSRTGSAPFATDGSYLAYRGNEGVLRSFADLGLLYESNKSGADVFGTYSQQVTGGSDLNPVLTANTSLSELRGGLGITRGSIAISDGTTTSIIDISRAATIGDVAAMIEANPPSGRTIKARVTSTGLELQLDTAGGGGLTVKEVGAGTTAAQLGIFHPISTGTGPLVGHDLNPRLTPTTKLADVLGARAIAVIRSDGKDNDIILEAREVGAADNGVTVQFVDEDLLQAGPALQAGFETASYSDTPVASRAALSFTGFNNNLLLTASTPGLAFNNVEIELVDAGAIGNNATVNYDSSNKRLTIGIDSTGATEVQAIIDALATEGTFTASYDPSDPVDGGFSPTATVSAVDIGTVRGNTGNSGGDANTIYVHIDPGATTANQVVAALANDPTISARFDVRLDLTDKSLPINAGLAPVSINATGTTIEGRGEPLDLTSGLRIVNGDQTYVIDTSSAQTVEDLINLLHGSGANVLAEINANGTGINVRSLLSGANFSIGENGGTTATQLGIRSFTGSTALSDLNFGRGVETTTGTDFTIRRRDGYDLGVDVSGATTVQQVIDRINGDVNNQDPATQVIARLAAIGNGIELIDTNSAGIATLAITQAFGSSAAADLGLVPPGSTTTTAATSGSNQVLTGRDTNPQEVLGVFNTLLRLRDAIGTGDLGEIERLSAQLDVDLNRVNFARSDLGQRGQALDSISARLDDDEIQLKDSLSKEIDVDLIEAITNLTARQASYEASLQLTGQTFRLSLLDYL